MKKILLLFLVFVITINKISAQKFYTTIAAGYGWSMASENLTSKITSSAVQTENMQVKGSLGKGINTEAAVGYKLTDNISTEINMFYLIGAKYKGSYYKENEFDEQMSISATMFRVAPSIRITAGQGKLKPYARIGALFRVFGNIITKDTYYNIQSNTVTQSDWKYTKGFSAGIVSSLGATYSITDKLALVAELNMNNQSWGPKKGKCIKYEINGVDNLPNLTPEQKDTDFSNSYTSANNTPAPAYQPRQQLRQYFPFSSIGINVGVHYIFGKK